MDRTAITTAVILAAGRGSRLHPITQNRSKAMLPILGKPMVQRVMDDLASNGIRDFILVVSPDDSQIVRYFFEETAQDTHVRFVYQPERRGMADALRYAAPFIDTDFILSACDNLISARFIGRMLTRWKQGPLPNGLLSLLQVEPEQLGSMAVVIMEGEWVTRIIEKPGNSQRHSNLASLPLYIFSHQILNYLPDVPLSPRSEYELQDAIQMLIERAGGVCGLTAESRLTLTNAADLLAINRRFMEQGRIPTDSGPGSIGAHTKIIAPVYIESEAVIGSQCVIGPNVYIEKNCTIGDRVTITNAVILRDSTVESGSLVQNRIFS